MDFIINPTSMMNIIFIAIGIGICGLCILHMTSASHIRKDVRVYFIFFFSFILLYITAHMVRELMDGRSGEAVRAALYIVTFIEILSAGVMAQMMSLLIIAVTKKDSSVKPLVIVLDVLLLIHLVILIVGWPFDLIYHFDENNVYARGNLYLLSNAVPVIILIIDAVLLIKYRKNVDRQVASSFWSYIIIPVVAIVVQGFTRGLQLIIFATVGCAVYMFSVIIARQNNLYQKQQQENSRIEAELSMASAIQNEMLPGIYPAFPERLDFDIYASMQTAKEVGGDFYDFALVDDDHLYLLIADVSGKGVPAALFMMASKIIFANNAMLGKSPAQIIYDTNNAICSNNGKEMFVTAWIGILELSTGKLTAANAGHEYPVIYHKDGKFEYIKDKHGLVVGGMSGVKYEEYEVQLKPGSKIYLYTDGVTEATSSSDELFGFDRLKDALNVDPTLSPKGVCTKVGEAVNAFVNKAEQFDDITMLCVEYKGK